MINRRDLLLGIGATSLAGCVSLKPPREQGSVSSTDITVRSQVRGNPLRSSFLGLSYESALLADPAWFDAGNATLVRLLRNLAPDGVLRLGGNASDFALWQRESSAGTLTPAPFKHRVTPADIDRLAAFLDATGWRLVYGINLAHGDPQRAADEAAYVAQRIGGRLDALQIGNEPDLYERHGLRPSGYGADAFIAEWRQYAAAIRARAGDVPLAGPDVAFKQDWIEAFAGACGGDVKFLSDHYYPVGPAQDADVDISTLFRSEAVRAEQLRPVVESGARHLRPVRMTEANSCFGGGKPGVSDNVASALWGATTAFGLCREGWSGLYFHGGPQQVYSPIGLDGGAFVARPLYYGMLFLSRAAPATLVDVEIKIKESNPKLRFFAGVAPDGRLHVAIVNQDQANAADVRVDADRPLKSGAVLRLLSPTLFSRSNIELGGAGIEADGSWKPLPTEPAVVDRNAAFVTVSAAGAVLLTLD